MARYLALGCLLAVCSTPTLAAGASAASETAEAHEAQSLSEDGVLIAQSPPKRRKGKSSSSKSSDSSGAAAGSSRANRQGKVAFVAAEIALVNLFHSGQGVEAGYFLSPDTLIEVGYLSADFEFFSYKSNFTFLTVDYHWFATNSFYVFGGAGLRTISSESSSLFSDSRTSTFDRSAIIVEAGIGNRWQWDNFTMGCDWVAHAAPVVDLGSSESFDGEWTDEEKESEAADFESNSGSGNTILVRFHLGWAF